MKNVKNTPLTKWFDHFANKVTMITGHSGAFMLALLSIIIWLLSGFVFNFSDTWQLVINTSTTIVTFLMVFLIQKTQNKDSLAIQLKLNELVSASAVASNRMVNIEDLTEEDLLVLHRYYSELAVMAKKDETLRVSHSIEEAREKHEEKMGKRKER